MPALSKIGGGDLSKLAEALSERRYAVDDEIVQEGDPADAFFLVQEGECSVGSRSLHGA